MKFKLHSKYQPTGDQPEAIAKLLRGLDLHERYQTLKGVTGSGKTFTMANIIAKQNRPTLILAHNKTLAAQLYSEFRDFSPTKFIILYLTSIIINQKPTSHRPILISKKTLLSTKKLIDSVMVLLKRF